MFPNAATTASFRLRGSAFDVPVATWMLDGAARVGLGAGRAWANVALTSS
jgi:hypothetical protein